LSFDVKLSKRAYGELMSLQPATRSRVVQRLEELRDDPSPRGAIKLQGRADTYRVRVGDYRVLYEVQKKDNVVLVVKADHRSGVYGP
jgi:mRNA interferase RelE/StbE